jgi:hypothetical protein
VTFELQGPVPHPGGWRTSADLVDPELQVLEDVALANELSVETGVGRAGIPNGAVFLDHRQASLKRFAGKNWLARMQHGSAGVAFLP